MKNMRIFRTILFTLFVVCTCSLFISIGDVHAISPPDRPVPLVPIWNRLGYTNPNFIWKVSSGADEYHLRIYAYGSQSFIHTKTVSTSVCSGGKCRYRFSPSLDLPKGAYYWQVQAENMVGPSDWSARRRFSRCNTTGFNSQFNGNATCWEPNYGAKWNWTSKFYFSNGRSGQSTNTSYPVDFEDFVYTVRMKRKSANIVVNSGILLRGDSRRAPGNNWKNTYDFGYGNGGAFSVNKVVDGVFTVVHGDTSTPAIHTGQKFNTLKVRVKGNKFWYFINGTLVWSGTDNSFSSGRVGVNVFDGGPGERLYVDWAKLTKIE